MAKLIKSLTFTGASIDSKSRTITEYDKDGNPTIYSIDKILEDWDGIDNISFGLKVGNTYKNDTVDSDDSDDTGDKDWS